MPNEVPAQSVRQDVITDSVSFLDAFMHVNRLLLGFKNLVVKNRMRKLPRFLNAALRTTFWLLKIAYPNSRTICD